jgi:dTDP-4-amino-4,6-dideoxygalactose transaminase
MMIHQNIPYVVGNEISLIKQAIDEHKLCAGGYFTNACQEILEKEIGTKKVLLTTSCTDALEMCALLLNIRSGDEVIVPSFTFVSTINAFVLRGAEPVFVDIRQDTLNIDEHLIEKKITPRTKAIILIHYAGISSDMDTIQEIGDKYKIPIVEDNAHSLFGKYKGRALGTFGCLAAQSFHETKNIQCGEGGALVINDEQYIKRATVLLEKGTNRYDFVAGNAKDYTWVDIGSSFGISEMLSAFLLAQLQNREIIQAKRKAIWEYYMKNLKEWAIRNCVSLPTVPKECIPAYHLFYILMPSQEIRQKLTLHLRSKGIGVSAHYLPLNKSPMSIKLGVISECPIAETVSSNIVRLPFYNSLTEQEIASVVEGITSFNV